MSQAREERRLAAIVIGDVVGYSRMMGLDEIGTMGALKAHRRDFILPLLTSFRARLVNSTGDAMLLEFGSAVDAVACAANLQRGMQARNTGIDPERQIRFRLGINLGDIVIDGTDMYGDGINVAARLETMCEPGGLCLSRAVEEQVKDKLPYVFEDRGEQTLKNIARPVRVYALTPDAIAELPEPPLAAEPRLAAAARLEVTPGTTLNDTYAVDRLIGSGGMGEIFAGHEIHTGDAVAIKLIRLDMEGNEAALGLFQKEASVLRHVYHEAVVRYYIFSFDTAVHRHYLAMEYVDGYPLSDLASRGPLSFEAVDALRKRVAAGLAVAHERGVVHRDVSPDNIILPDGDVARAKIIDFGIARSATLGGGTIIGGGFAGKYNYVSPEQLGLFGGDVTGRSDIYSFGLVLAGALLGAPLDMGGSQVEIIEKRRTVPDLEKVDSRLRPLIAAMLQPDPEQRPALMADVATWSPSAAPHAGTIPASPFPTPVQPTLSIAPQPRPATRVTPVPPARKRSATVWIIGGALGLALLGAGGLALMDVVGHKPSAPPMSPTLNGGPSLTPPGEPSAPLEKPPGGNASAPPGEAPTPPKTQPAQTPPVAPPVASGPAQRVAAFLSSYDGGPCFFAQPGDVTEHSAGIEALGGASESFDAFVRAFAASIGFEPDLTGNKIWSRQCPAAGFLKEVHSADVAPPSLFLKSARLRSGQTLAGEVGSVANRSVMLLWIREDGTVADLSQALRTKGDNADFDLPLPREGGPYPQLIVAITTPKPLSPPAAGQTADQVFPALLKAAAESRQPIAANARLVLAGG